MPPCHSHMKDDMIEENAELNLCLVITMILNKVK